MNFRAAFPSLLALSLSACNAAPSSDASMDRDAAAMPDGGVDAFAQDALRADDAPMQRDASTSGTTSIAMTYAMQTRTFDRAFMGYVRTGGAITGLYFEFSRGADAACPSETSPTPQQVITVDGFAPAAPAPQTTGIMARFFDFEGLFREEIRPDAPTMARVEVTSLDTTRGTAEGTVMFTFERGTASGTFQATHCDSLDSM